MLNQIPQESVDRYAASEPYTPFPYENLLCEIISKGYTVGQYNEVIWRSTGDETHNKYVSGFVKLEEKGDRWFFPGNCIKRAIGNTEETLRLCKENNITLTEEERYQLYAHLIVNQYKYGVFRYKVTYETPSLASHYAVNCRKVGRKELNRCRHEIRDGYIDYIRSKEGVNEQYEHIITTAIGDSDKQWRRQRRIGRVIAFLSKVKHTLMGR